MLWLTRDAGTSLLWGEHRNVGKLDGLSWEASSSAELTMFLFAGFVELQLDCRTPSRGSQHVRECLAAIGYQAGAYPYRESLTIRHVA